MAWRSEKRYYTFMTVTEFHAIVQRQWHVTCDMCQQVRQQEEPQQTAQATEDADTTDDEDPEEAAKKQSNRNKRWCADCRQWLVRAEFAEEQWQASTMENRTCKSCLRVPKTTILTPWVQEARMQREKQREKRRVKAAKQEQHARRKALEQEYGIAFYDSRVLWDDTALTTKVESDDDRICGEYDVIFHTAGGLSNEPIAEQRSTKGTAVFMLDNNDEHEVFDGTDTPQLTGRFQFCEELYDGYNARGDFTVKCFRGTLYAPDVPLMQDEETPVSLEFVTRRCALPWIRHEEMAKNDNKRRSKVKFESLEQAVTLAMQYEAGPPDAQHSWMARPQFLGTETLARNVLEYLWFYQRKPVLFLEPGDLVVNLDLLANADMSDMVNAACSKYILRRKQDIASLNTNR